MNILVVYKKSTLELYQKSNDSDVREYMAKENKDTLSMVSSDQAQRKTLSDVIEVLKGMEVNFTTCYRAEMGETDSFDLILVVGGDGTLLDVSHRTRKTPILAINSDPNRSVGFFSCYEARDLEQVLRQLSLEPTTKLTRLQLQVDEKVIQELALNDVLFAHKNPAATSRYEVSEEGWMRSYKNSGLLLSTGAGSSGWMHNEGGELLPLSGKEFLMLHRGMRNSSPIQTKEIELFSHTRSGMLYLDGPHLKIPLSLGQRLKITPGPSLCIIGDLEKKRKAGWSS